MPKGRLKVLVTDKIDAAGLAPLKADARIDLQMAVGDKERMAELVPGAHVWLVRSETKVTEEWLSKARALRLIGRAGVGVDNIDVPGASRRGIAVINAPAANTISACEHSWALILALARGVAQADASVKGGKWERSKFMGVELAGKTLGLVGLGRIGRESAKRAQAFGMKVLAYDPYISAKQAEGMGLALADFKDLLEASDFVSLHVPLTDKTRRMIDAKSLAWFKKGARLVNCARGELIDDAALADALRSGRLAGAALDVFDPEPLAADSPLRGAPNIVLTPHLGASTVEAQLKVAEELARSVLEFHDRGVARNAINLPGFDPDLLEALGPWLDLAETLGRFLGQTMDGGLKAVRCRFHGDFPAPQRHPLAVAALKGTLSSILESTLSYINAPLLALERGIEHSEASAPAAEGYPRLLEVTAVTDLGERSVSGAVGLNGALRLVRLDDLTVDVTPRGKMLVLSNTDKPGIIGAIGTLLGRHGVNIADMRVGRQAPHGTAVMVITVDEDPSPELRSELRKLDGVRTVRWVVL
ncbi:MAG: phosphoglycerate dehydrogenase [Elusimicrobia bacterium]|nr:phosphoglycerate dehydrogenase [Elusimicrobiota bacterium]